MLLSVESSLRKYREQYMRKPFLGSSLRLISTEQRFTDLAIPVLKDCINTTSIQWIVQHGSTGIAGGAYSLGLPNGFISVCPLYRYDFGIDKHAIQLSNCYFAAWKWCELYGYNHAWYNGGFNFFGEERFHIKVVENLKVGAILNITHFGTWDAYLSVGIRYDL